MNKLLGFLMGLCLVFVVVGSASSTPVSFDVAGAPDSNVILSDISTFGWTSLSASLSAGIDDEIFNLNDGQTKEIDFFTLTASGTGLGSANIEATLAFDAPPALEGTGSGDADWGSFLGFIAGGILTWDQSTLPDTVTLADGNSITLDFEDGVAITLDGTVTVHAYITNNGGGAPVPEPATMVLLGVGLLGVASVSRKKYKK